MLAVSDAATLAELADQTIVIVRWMRTPRHFVSATLERLGRCRAHISGVVMTPATLTRSAKSNPYMLHYADRSFRKSYLRPPRRGPEVHGAPPGLPFPPPPTAAPQPGTRPTPVPAQ